MNHRSCLLLLTAVAALNLQACREGANLTTIENNNRQQEDPPGNIRLSLAKTSASNSPLHISWEKPSEMLTFEVAVATDKECKQRLVELTVKDSSEITVRLPKPGSYYVCVWAFDAEGKIIAASEGNGVTIIDKDKPVITGARSVASAEPVRLKIAVQDHSDVSYSWKQIDGPGTVTFSNRKAQNPTVSADTDGTYQIQVTATDVVGNASQHVISFVWSGSPTVSWDSEIADTSVTEDSALTGLTASATDTAASVAYSLDAGNMTCDEGSWSPPVAVNSVSGEITGTPTNDDVGDCTVTVVATGSQEVVSQTFTISVTNSPDPITWISTISATAAIEGQALSLAAAATDPDLNEDPVYSFDAVNMTCDEQTWSSALSIDSSTGSITGTPTGITNVTSCTIKVVASSNGDSVDQTFTLSIYPEFPAGFSCDSGSAMTTCYVNTTKNLANLDLVAAPGSLVIQSGGNLAGLPEETIALSWGGDIVIDSGGAVTANLSNVVATNFTVAAGGSINVSANGYAGGTLSNNGSGPGAGTGAANGGGGAAYGGNGGVSRTGIAGGTAYGSSSAPADFGSGGGAADGSLGGAGGGKIKLDIDNALIINGDVLANGGAGGNTGGDGAGGGAGGAIWLIANSITGSGSLRAEGGAGGNTAYEGGGGGGGRITLDAVNLSFSGLISAKRGGATNSAASGFEGSFVTDITDPCDAGSLSTVCTVSNTKPLGDSQTITGTGDLVIANGGNVYTPGHTNTISIAMGGDVTVESGGVVNANISSALAANFTIEVGGTVTADSLGYEGGIRGKNGLGPGPGAGSNSGGGGGAYGGDGGASRTGAAGGTAYGSATMPADFGSGGGGGDTCPGGAGGGKIKLDITNALVINGDLSVNGEGGSDVCSDGGGGGAGGSIWLIADSVTGSGNITAEGGAGANTAAFDAGGGGGGRIMLEATNIDFAGGISVQRGTATQDANAGFEGSFATDITNPCDTGSLSTTCTVSNPKPLGHTQAITGTGDLVVASGGYIYTPGHTDTISIAMGGDITVENGGMIHASISSAAATNFTVDAGGTVKADFLGYEGGIEFKNGLGPGAGVGGDSGGGGGAYGGNGGASRIGAAGGTAYGSATMPADFGSGGGGGDSCPGGAGGGKIKLDITNALVINGDLSVNGAGGSEACNDGGGGGAGGSIWLIADSVTGSGNIKADGGAGGNTSAYNAGGGGGGRIMLDAENIAFAGSISVQRGAATENAYAGFEGSFATDITNPCDVGSLSTVCTVTSAKPLGDTQAIAGTGDLVVASGGYIYTPGHTNSISVAMVGDVTVESGGVIDANISSATAANFTIDAGGAIKADAIGYEGGVEFKGGMGPGAGAAAGSSGGGGAYGGNGGSGAAAGGLAYGSNLAPTDFGSGGGGGDTCAAGAGGGKIKLDVTGMLTINGDLTAKGEAGSNLCADGAGGGAGGSIWLLADSVTGSGNIVAEGGSGGNASVYGGGGGGGGRVAIDYATGDTFSGVVSVSGAAAVGNGGAGSAGTECWNGAGAGC